MRFAVDENVPFLIVQELERLGHDVWSVARDSSSMADETILPTAVHEDRILITFDGDFVRLIFRDRQPAPPAMVYMRSRPENAIAVATHFLEAIEDGAEQVQGRLMIIDERRMIRFSLMPGSAK